VSDALNALILLISIILQAEEAAGLRRALRSLWGTRARDPGLYTHHSPTAADQ